MLPVTLDPNQLPDDIETLKAMVIAAERKASDRGLEIEALKLTIAKLQRNTFGASSESGKKLLDQLELQLAELEEGMAEDKAAASVRPSRSRRRHRIRSHAAVPDRNSWPRSCSPSTGRICRSSGRATSMPTKASISTCPRWLTGSARAQRR